MDYKLLMLQEGKSFSVKGRVLKGHWSSPGPHHFVYANRKHPSANQVEKHLPHMLAKRDFVRAAGLR